MEKWAEEGWRRGGGRLVGGGFERERGTMRMMVASQGRGIFFCKGRQEGFGTNRVSTTIIELELPNIPKGGGNQVECSSEAEDYGGFGGCPQNFCPSVEFMVDTGLLAEFRKNFIARNRRKEY
ncbi:hypothetical protein HAX54_041967 [Datura stramonium]|uniref:Uncharacterized protein n=1 Tax=Datura stramonium TaxID=4076 RepID=A0ABS8W3C0_DATST|nr:hypothetical protein [Datura stramonium]